MSDVLPSAAPRLLLRQDANDDDNANDAALGRQHNNSLQQPRGSSAAEVPISAALTQLPLLPGDDVHDQSLFPSGAVDADRQQLDLRRENSWTALLHQVPIAEAIECHCVNALAPMVLCGRLRGALAAGASASPVAHSWIVNVSAMEGKFYRFKLPTHAHTNMAKASLNMMTRTAASDYANDGILMNCIDTGWINDENPTEVAMRRFTDENFQTPIDELDAAVRILGWCFEAPMLARNFLFLRINQ